MSDKEYDEEMKEWETASLTDYRDFENLGELEARDAEYQIEIVGGSKVKLWTVNVCSRAWIEDIQRYRVKSLGACATTSLPRVFSFISQVVKSCPLPLTLRNDDKGGK